MTINQRDLRIIEECRRTDEPVIVIRGQDKLGKLLVNFYHSLAVEHGTAENFREAVLDKYEQFLQFEKDHPDRMKVPDLRDEEVKI